MTIRETQFCLARVYLSTGRSIEAIPILEQLCKETPEESRFVFRLIAAYMQTGSLAKALDLAENQGPIVEKVITQLDKDLEELKDALESNDKDRIDLFVKKVKKINNYRRDFVRIDLLKADICLKMEKKSFVK